MKTPLKRFYIVAWYRGDTYITDTRDKTLAECYVTAHHWMNEPGTRVEIHGPFRAAEGDTLRRVDERPGAGFQTREDARRQHRAPTKRARRKT